MPARTSILAAIVVAASALLPVAAQTGGLEVRVVVAGDRSPLPGATVVLENSQQLIPRASVIADGEGAASFPVLRAGQGYVVDVFAPGYSRQRMTDVRVRTNETLRLVFALSPASTEVVTVTARTDVVDLDQTASATQFSDELIEQLPVAGRFYQNILTLAPGVNDANEDGNPNVHGARERDFKATVGGVSNVDPLTGEWLSFIHPMSIEELEVITAGAGVEFGRAQGGFARILQKQGTNEFEGMVRLLYRSSELDGRGAQTIPDALVPNFTWTQPSIQLSGPIVRDKLWFRLAQERINGEDPQNLLGSIDVVSRSQQVDSDQITWQATPRNKFAFEYQGSDLTLSNYGISSTIPAESSQTLVRSGPTYSMSWVVPYSAQLLVDSLVAWQDLEQRIEPTTVGVEQDCVGFGFYDSLNTTRCYNADNGRTSGSFPESSVDHRQRLTVSSNVTLFEPHFAGTSHRLKLGFGIEDETFTRELVRGPDVDFYVQRLLLQPCPIGGADPCFQRVGFATALINAPKTSAATATGINWSVYAEDQLKPASNLALTIGLRLDHEEIDSEGVEPLDPSAEAAEFLQRYSPFINAEPLAQQVFTGYPDIEGFRDEVAQALGVTPDEIPLGPHALQSTFWARQQRAQNIAIRNNNPALRLSLAWDPRGDGKTKLAVSAGRYYDKIFLAVPLVELEPVSTTLLWRALTFGSGRFYTVYPISDLHPTVRRQMVDRDLSTPYQDELALSLEHALGAETSLQLTYIRRQFRDQLQDVDINHLPADRGRCVIANSLADNPVLASYGEGADLTDPYTGEHYLDTDPGPGDGRIDDCSGRVDVVAYSNRFPPTTVSRAAPDGLDDLYVLNPGWGEILLVGNFNQADYEAFVLELTRRRFRNWEMLASYTWSRAQGDAEDFDQNLGNERNLRDDEQGWLDYDQRHVLRVNAATVLPLGFHFGASLRWESGLPYSVLQSTLTLYSVPPEYQNIGDYDVRYRQRYPTGQRNDQRNPSFWNLDLMFSKNFELGRRLDLQLTLETFNLLNDGTVSLDQRLDGVNSGLGRFGRRYQLGASLTF